MTPISHIRSLISSRAGSLIGRSTAPSWLVSMVIHLVGFILLTLWIAEPQRVARLGLRLQGSLGDASAAFDSDPSSQAMGNANPNHGAAMFAPAAPISDLAEAVSEASPFEPGGALPARFAASGVRPGDALGAAGGSADGGSRGNAARIGAKGQVRTGIFGAESEGYRFVYVFDRSSSMGGSGRNALSAAKAELLGSLQHLDKRHHFQIIFYNEKVFPFTMPSGDTGMIEATDANKALASQFVSSILPEGATHHEEALDAAIALKPDVIFFLTDADEPKLYPGQLARIRRAAAGITINTIEFGLGSQADANDFLVRLARENRGQHAYVDVTKLGLPSGAP